eukprot:12404488-Karenia_brevis.AAC.1
MLGKCSPQAAKGLTVLEEFSVEPATVKDYQRRMVFFHSFVAEHSLPMNTVSQCDEAPVGFTNFVFLEGAEKADAERTYAAFIFEHPDCSRKG